MHRTRIVAALLVSMAVAPQFLADAAIATPLLAHFSLLGEVNRLNTLGFGSLGIEVKVDDIVVQQGGMSFAVGSGGPSKSGIFSAVSVPSTGWRIVDLDFTAPFDVPTGGSVKFDVDFNAGGIRLVWDFTNQITWGGSLLGSGGEQGLRLTAITLPNGDPLSSANLALGFVEANTRLSAFATNGTNQPSQTVTPPDSAAVNAGGGGVASAEMGIDPLLYLRLDPEPNPLVADSAKARMFASGGPNLTLIAVPAPSTMMLLGLGSFGLALATRMLDPRRRK